jgi:hypothetical protein
VETLVKDVNKALDSDDTQPWRKPVDEIAEEIVS